MLMNLNVTGPCDAYTISCIKALQTDLKNSGNPTMVVDGRVSKASATLYYGSDIYTIAQLNFVYRRCYWINWPAISMDGDCNAVTTIVYRDLYGTPDP